MTVHPVDPRRQDLHLLAEFRTSRQRLLEVGVDRPDLVMLASRLAQPFVSGSKLSKWPCLLQSLARATLRAPPADTGDRQAHNYPDTFPRRRTLYRTQARCPPDPLGAVSVAGGGAVGPPATENGPANQTDAVEATSHLPHPGVIES